jgi:hypothetical protein
MKYGYAALPLHTFYMDFALQRQYPCNIYPIKSVLIGIKTEQI